MRSHAIALAVLVGAPMILISTASAQTKTADKAFVSGTDIRLRQLDALHQRLPLTVRSSWPPARPQASRACARTGYATPSPPASAKAAPTPPRSKPCSVTRLWTPRLGTSEPEPPRPLPCAPP